MYVFTINPARVGHLDVLLPIILQLKKDNPEICDVRYPIKVEKKDGEKVNYGKMRVKETEN